MRFTSLPSVEFYNIINSLDQEMPYLALAYHGRSMQSTFREGDLLLVRPINVALALPGDVVAFRRKSQLDNTVSVIVHRVQSCVGEELVTRGDNNAIHDMPISAEDLIGRVCYVWRGGRLRHTWNGYAGLLWAYYIRFRHRIFPWASRVYNFARRVLSPIYHLWQSDIIQIELVIESGTLVKYVCHGRTIAHWQPQQQHFWCRKPYDLFLHPED